MQKLYGLPEIALIDMGDFVGGMLKYLRRHPVPRVTIAGGVAKMTKLAQGLTDLHSRRGEVDFATLAGFAEAAGGSAELCARIKAANTAAEAFALAQSEGHRARRRGRARGAGRRRRASSPAATSPSRSCCSIASKIWSAARRFSRLDVRSRGASAEPAAIIGVIERAVAKIFAPRARGRP